MINVVVADDHPIFRAGIVHVLSNDQSIHVLDDCGDGESAVKSIVEYAPDVVILDIDMPKMTGLDVVRKLRKLGVDVKIILLTMLDDLDLLKEAKSLGVSGYITKDCFTNSLVNCIKKIYHGEVCYTDSLEKQLVDNPESTSFLDQLTKSERNVIKLIARNKSSKDISKMLFISPKTVDNHRSNICKKLNISGPNAINKFLIENRINKF